ncbi:MAG: hypothetical protein KDE31_38550, partial [Caldilineaceae bacterium]|nr:hypothetical protein [Caldilineaceae bacterium]
QNPAARLRLGDTTLARIQPLTDLLTTIYTTDTPRTTTYFIPATAQPYTDLLQRLQPTSLVDQQLDPVSGQLLFSQLTVSAADLRARQGLLGVAWDGSGNATELTTAAAGALVVPGATVPITVPYTVQWSGALRVAMPGTYGFMLTAANGAMPTTGLITLQLDNQLIIDSSLGLLNQEVPLVKGFYQLTLQYQVAEGDENDELAQYAVHWQRPDGVDEVIPQQQLSNLPLPNIGLIGEYYWGDAPSGAPFEIRKDLVVGYVPDRQEPYVIRWRGQIGAGRGGEYLFAALSAPGSATQITIDGVQLADSTLANAGADDARATSPTRTSAYAEGVMYLNRGWHAIEIIHRPDATHAPVQLFWQPPGSGPAPVDAAYLAPIL